MSTPIQRDPRRRRPPFDVPSERRRPLDLVVTAVIALSVLVVAGIVWFGGSASRSDLTTPAAAPTVFQPARELPAALTELFRSPSTGTDAPLVTRSNLVTTESGRVVGRAAGTGVEDWSYEHSGDLCGARFFSDRLVTVWNGTAGCSDVTAINGSTGDYAGTRQSPFPDTARLISVWDYVMAFHPERLEIWRSDLVRTVEYGHVDAPQESAQQPRSGCTMRSAGLASDRFAVSERCPGDASERLTISKTVPKDSRKPEETASEVTGADEIHVVDVLKDGVLAVRSQGGRWAVVLYTSPTQVRTVVELPGAPTQLPGAATLAPGTSTVRWFDGAKVHAFARDTGAEKWSMPAKGPGIEYGYGTGVPDQNQPNPSTLVPVDGAFVGVDTQQGTEQRRYRFAGTTAPAAGPAGMPMAQIGDVVYVRSAGEVIAYGIPANARR